MKRVDEEKKINDLIRDLESLLGLETIFDNPGTRGYK